ncbi:hypothetical protein C8J57DRAFT_1243403 [Mycena rebaudengoi]|nr:hypothetical protein C8J57DRAFT_1243403 [Mycena rebaudengoi]
MAIRGRHIVQRTVDRDTGRRGDSKCYTKGGHGERSAATTSSDEDGVMTSKHGNFDGLECFSASANRGNPAIPFHGSPGLIPVCKAVSGLLFPCKAFQGLIQLGEGYVWQRKAFWAFIKVKVINTIQIRARCKSTCNDVAAVLIIRQTCIHVRIAIKAITSSLLSPTAPSFPPLQLSSFVVVGSQAQQHLKPQDP